LDDRAGYDAIFDMSNTFFDMSNTLMDDLIPQVIEVLNKKESVNTPELKTTLCMRAAAARVKADIAQTQLSFFLFLMFALLGTSL